MNSFLHIILQRLLRLTEKPISISDGDYFIVELNKCKLFHKLPILLAEFVTNLNLICLDTSLGDFLHSHVILVLAESFLVQDGHVVVVGAVRLFVRLLPLLGECIEDHQRFYYIIASSTLNTLLTINEL